MLTRKKVQTTIVLIIGIIILINLISDRIFFRWDFTEDQRYSLSNATKDILKNLDEPVTVTAYFSEDLPPDIEKVRDDFRDLLIEYTNASDGNLVFEFVNPNESQEIEVKAQQNGISPIMINVREKDQVKQQKAYLGALIQMGDKKEVIPFIQPGAAMEYALSTNIKKISLKIKPKIGLLQGNDEPKLSDLQQLNQALSVLYDVQTLQFNDTSGVPGNIKTLMIIAPKDSINPKYFKYLDGFLGRGGRLLVAINRVKGDFQTSKGEEVKTGLADWLKKYGVEVEQNFIVDASCSNVMVRQQQGMFVMNTPVSFPYIPIITKFADHPITKGLESVLMPFVSSIKIEPKDSSIAIYPLAMSSKRSGIETPPIFFNVTKRWGPTDFNLSRLPVAVAVEGKLYNDVPTKMVVFADGDFIINGEGQKKQRLQKDNISLMANAVDWLSDDTGLAELRTKGVTSRPIDPSLEASTKTLLKYLNFLLPILLIIIYGIYRSQRRKSIREKLKNTHYV